MGKTIIHNGTIINESRQYRGYITIDGELISGVFEGDPTTLEGYNKIIDAKNGYILPGVIDDQVHFRQPGLTHKGDIHTESRAAVAGGITSYMEMPNTIPTTTSLQELQNKHRIAEEHSLANYSFYLGATNTNADVIASVDPKKVCGIKLFMGSSTGNMMVDDQTALAKVFAVSPILVAVHCEEESIVRDNLKRYKARYGEAITPSMHPLIRSREACYASSAKAVELAHKYNSRLHLLHVSTAKEMSLFEAKPLNEKRITSEVCVHHLWFSDADYAAKGNFIKWNPAIKTKEDRLALRQALTEGIIDVVATDHAPHTLEEKSRPYLEAPSGGPLVQHSLVAMLEMTHQHIFSKELVVEKMSHSPALLFGVHKRGFLRTGYFADVVVVHTQTPFAVTKQTLLYKCGWSPFEGTSFGYSVAQTFVNGTVVYDEGVFNESNTGQALTFER